MDPGDTTPIIIIIKKIETLEPENASKIIEYFLLQEMKQTDLLRYAFGPDSLIQEFCGKAKSELSDWGHLLSKGFSSNPSARPFNTNDQSLSQSCGRNQFLNLSRNSNTSLSPSLIRNNPNSNSSLFHGGSSQFPFPHNKNPFDNLHKRSFSENDAFLESEQQRMIAARGSPMSNIQGSGQFGVEGAYVSPSEEIAQPQQQRMISARGSLMSNIQGSGQFGVEGGNSYSPGRHETEDINSRTIYLTFPPESTFTDKDASTYFSNFGPVVGVRIPNQERRVYGFVTFAKAETVITVLAEGNPHLIGDSTVIVKPYKEKENILQKQGWGQFQVEGGISPRSHEREDIIIKRRKIFFTFPPESSLTEGDVSTYFSKFGSVVDVRIPADQEPRVYGFVTFAKAETVRTILDQVNPHYICKSRVYVKPSIKKAKLLQNSN